GFIERDHLFSGCLFWIASSLALLAMTGRLATLLCVVASRRSMLFAVTGRLATLLCVVASRRSMLFAVTGELDTLLHDYLSSVIARSIATKQSSYLSVIYRGLLHVVRIYSPLCDYSSSVVAGE
ncbi:MAG: hypothetical protein LBJ43_01440, partial [Propionibacteriaceae bacterium]|nr:hypothetical protein [Propionibacteriaceae bacterium]